MIKNMGWGTFLLWGLFDLVIGAYSWFGLAETRGKTLEEISGQATPADQRPGTGSSKVLIEENGDGLVKGPRLVVR